jgi:RNA 2',3'-cyclic 3'-phosphodiesterase
MNLFLGFPIPAADIHTLTRLLLQEHPHWENHPHIRWTLEQNHHLTVHFFGPLEPALLSNFIINLENYLNDKNNFIIKINKLYNFPKANSELLAAYIEPSIELLELYTQVQKAVVEHGFTPEPRKFFPHITLCRAKCRGVLVMEPLMVADYPITLSNLTLYQSQSTAQGSQYLPLHQWRHSRQYRSGMAFNLHASPLLV